MRSKWIVKGCLISVLAFCLCGFGFSLGFAGGHYHQEQVIGDAGYNAWSQGPGFTYSSGQAAVSDPVHLGGTYNGPNHQSAWSVSAQPEVFSSADACHIGCGGGETYTGTGGSAYQRTQTGVNHHAHYGQGGGNAGAFAGQHGQGDYYAEANGPSYSHAEGQTEASGASFSYANNRQTNNGYESNSMAYTGGSSQAESGALGESAEAGAGVQGGGSANAWTDAYGGFDGASAHASTHGDAGYNYGNHQGAYGSNPESSAQGHGMAYTGGSSRVFRDDGAVHAESHHNSVASSSGDTGSYASTHGGVSQNYNMNHNRD